MLHVTLQHMNQLAIVIITISKKYIKMLLLIIAAGKYVFLPSVTLFLLKLKIPILA